MPPRYWFAQKDTTPDGFQDVLDFLPWKGAVRIPLPAESTIECTLDRGRAVSQVWFAAGSIRAFCADHDPARLPLPAEQPFWWHWPWPYGPPPSYGARVATWLRSFPRPRRARRRR